MSKAFDDWIEDYKLNDDITLSADDYYYTLEFVKRSFNAGRAYQREEDAKIAEAESPYGYSSVGVDAGYEIAQTIREQKIDD